MQTYERSSDVSEDQPFVASMDDPDIRMHSNVEAGCQADILCEGCKVCACFGRSSHGGLRVLGFAAPDGVTGRIITHTPTSIDSMVARQAAEMCANIYPGCVIHHSESRVHQVKRSWVMLTQRFWQPQDRS